MAYTKILVVRHKLRRLLDYAANPEKTIPNHLSEEALRRLLEYTGNGVKTEHQLYVSGINCDAETAAEQILETRARWHKEGKGHVLAYHIIQSFSPGEISADEAHQIGVEFVRQFLPMYEATVSTHLDRKHLHNHIVFSAVSFMDGKMYRDSFANLHRIREISDELCRQHSLSVIIPKDEGKNYGQWKSERDGVETKHSRVRDVARRDVDAVMAGANSFEDFVQKLEQLGYSVKYGPKVKHMAVTPHGGRNGERSIRLRSLGADYTEEAIRSRIVLQAEEHRWEIRPEEPHTAQVPAVRYRRPQNVKRFRGRLSSVHHRKVGGWLGLYYHYLYLLGMKKKYPYSKRYQRYLKNELQRFERYVELHRFVKQRQLQSTAQIAEAETQAKEVMPVIMQRRKELYHLRRHAEESEKAKITAQIRELSARIREHRMVLLNCEELEAMDEEVRNKLLCADHEMQRGQHEEAKTQEERNLLSMQRSE